MKNTKIIFGALALLWITAAATAYDYNLNMVMWGNKTACNYTTTGTPVYDFVVDPEHCCFLLPSAGEINITFDYAGSGGGDTRLYSYNCSTNCNSIVQTYYSLGNSGTHKTTEVYTNTNTGLYCINAEWNYIYPDTSYVEVLTSDYGSFRNFSSGNTYGFPVPSYGNRMAISLDGEIIGETSANNKDDYKILNVTIPEVDTGLTYFSVNSWNSSNPTDDSETSAIINLVSCPNGKVLSKYPVDQTFFMTKGQNKTLFVLLANYSDDIVITFYDNGAVLQTGDKSQYSYTYTAGTSGRHILQMSAYSPTCNTWIWTSWYVYVDPDITLKGTCSCNNEKVQVFPICFKKNDSSVYKCTASTPDGAFDIDLPAGIYNLTITDNNYETYNSTINISIPYYQTSYPIYQYVNIDLTSKNITGERVITFKTDGGCNGLYNTVLKNTSFELFTSEGQKVFSLIDGTLSYRDTFYVVEYDYNETLGSLNLTLKAGYYFFEVGKTNYYPASNQDNTINIDYSSNITYGYSQQFSYFMENLSCSYPINYTIYTYTYDNLNKINLSNARLEFYNYFTGTLINTSYSDSTGKYEVNQSDKYASIKASKTGYGTDYFKGEITPNGNISLICKPAVPLRDIDIKIFDCATDKPITGVNVKLINQEDEVVNTAITGEDGRFFFDNVPEGIYKINYSLYGYGSKTLNLTLKRDYADYNTQCLNFDVNYCIYDVFLFDPDNNTLTKTDITAIDGITGEIVETQTTDDIDGYALFTLPRIYGTKNNEIGYKFKVNSDYNDDDQEKTYKCGSIVKHLTNYDLLDSFGEVQVLGIIEKYMWLMFLGLLFLFVVYVGVLMVRGIMR